MLNFNSNFSWWIGVVEDRQDPEQLGRCKVRIFGYHTNDTVELPTKDLPWALPMQPITSAAISGKGSTPIGPIEGTWVVGWFLDGDDMQQPLMVGTIGGKNKENPLGSVKKFRKPEETNVAKDSYNNPIYSSSGEPVLSNPKQSFDTRYPYITTDLPPLSVTNIKKLMDAIGFKESSSVAGGAQNYNISNNLKYRGKYQFGYDALAFLGYVKKFSTSQKNDKLDDKTIWTGKDGLNSIDDFYSNGKVQESIMFQYMAYHYNSLIADKVISTDDPPEHIAGILAAAHNGGRGNAIKYNSKDGNGVTRGEFYKIGNIALGGDGTIPTEEYSDTNRDTYVPTNGGNIKNDPTKALNDEELAKRRGFQDPNKVYPTLEYSGAPDTNKLARGDHTHTLLIKRENLRSYKINLANTSETYDEPRSTYCARYPYNQVFESEAGHIIELDSTPGKERVNIQHKNGSFIEFDINGSTIRKTVGDFFEMIDRNGYLYVRGAYNVTVDGSTKILVKNNAEIEVNGKVNLIGHGIGNLSFAKELNIAAESINMSATKGVKILSGEQMKMQGKEINFFSKDGNITAKSKDKIIMQSDNSTSINGGLELKLDAIVVKTKSGSTSLKEISIDLQSIPDSLSPIDSNFENLPIPDCDATTYLFDSLEDGHEDYRKSQLNNGKIIEGSPAVTEIDSAKTRSFDKTGTSCDCNEFSLYENFPDSLKLSKHFTLGPLSTRALAGSHTIVPQKGLRASDIVCNLKNLAVNCLDPIKDKYPNMRINSGFRQGSRENDHGLGMAADMSFSGVPINQYFEIVKWIKSNIPHKQLLLEYQDKQYGRTSWIHIAYDKEGKTSPLQVATLYNHRLYLRDGFANLG